MATNLRMQRPTWVFSILGAAILLGFVSILCFAVQAFLTSAFSYKTLAVGLLPLMTGISRSASAPARTNSRLHILSLLRT